MQPLEPREVQNALSVLQSKIDFPIQAGLVLGSGLGQLAEKIKKPIVIPYNEIPGIPSSTVSGHKGQFVAGFLQDTSVIVMQGRTHLYEGHHASRVTLAIRLIAALGVKNLLLTNAAGGINSSFSPGDLMLIKDHLNLLPINPLVGPHHKEWGDRFVDLSETYDKSFREVFMNAAQKENYNLKEGVYAANMGPSYETPAEVKMLAVLGADAVGMSTVHEAIVARQEKMKVAAVSLITNMGAGLEGSILDHADVMSVAEKNYDVFEKLIYSWLHELDVS